MSPRPKRSHAESRDLTAVVDRVTGVGCAEGPPEGAEIDHPGVGRPQEGVKVARGGLTGPRDLTPVVDACADTYGTAEGSEINHPGVGLPQEGVLSARGSVTAAHDLAAVVDSGGFADGA